MTVRPAKILSVSSAEEFVSKWNHPLCEPEI